MASFQADEPSAKRSNRPVNSVRFVDVNETTDLVTPPNEIVPSPSGGDDLEEINISQSG